MSLHPTSAILQAPISFGPALTTVPSFFSKLYPTTSTAAQANYVLKNAYQISSSSSSALNPYVDVFIMLHPTPDLRWSHCQLFTSLGQEITFADLTEEAKSTLVFLHKQELGFASPSGPIESAPSYLSSSEAVKESFPIDGLDSCMTVAAPSLIPHKPRKKTVAKRTLPIVAFWETEPASKASAVTAKAFKATPATSIEETRTCPLGFCDFIIKNGYKPSSVSKAAARDYQDVYVTCHTQPKLRWSHCRYITSGGQSISFADLTKAAQDLLVPMIASSDVDIKSIPLSAAACAASISSPPVAAPSTASSKTVSKMPEVSLFEDDDEVEVISAFDASPMAPLEPSLILENGTHPCGKKSRVIKVFLGKPFPDGTLRFRLKDLNNKLRKWADLTPEAQAELLKRNVRTPEMTQTLTQQKIRKKRFLTHFQQVLPNALKKPDGTLVDVELVTYQKKSFEDAPLGTASNNPYRLYSEGKRISFLNLTPEAQTELLKSGIKPETELLKSGIKPKTELPGSPAYAVLKNAYIAPTSGSESGPTAASVALDVDVFVEKVKAHKLSHLSLKLPGKKMFLSPKDLTEKSKNEYKELRDAFYAKQIEERKIKSKLMHDARYAKKNLAGIKRNRDEFFGKISSLEAPSDKDPQTEASLAKRSRHELSEDSESDVSSYGSDFEDAVEEWAGVNSSETSAEATEKRSTTPDTLPASPRLE